MNITEQAHCQHCSCPVHFEAGSFVHSLTKLTGCSILVLATGEAGIVTYVSPEGAVNATFEDGTNCRLSPSEFTYQ